MVLSMRKIKTKKVYEAVADAIIEMLKKGELKPGDRLDSVEKLADRFGVGRSAVREALSGLRTMGLVETRQGEGTFIKSFDPSKFKLPVTIGFLMKQDDVRELYEVRKILEVGAARLAAQNYEEEDLLEIEKAIILMENAKGNEKLAESADIDFHLAIARATHNQLLINLMNSVSDLVTETIRETRRVLIYSEKRSKQLLEEHQKIYEGIKKRDVTIAENAMYEHLKITQNLLFKIID